MILIITSANIQKDFENRRNDYIESYSIINHKYRTYFSSIVLLESVELMQYQYDFNFDKYILYGNKFFNKGMNEFDMINTYFKSNNNIDDQEQFVKLTGRYHIIDPKLLDSDVAGQYDFVGKSSYDMYIKNEIVDADSELFPEIQPEQESGIHTFYYMMKVGKLKEFYNHSINLDIIEEYYPMENEIKKYINENKWNINLLDHLGIFAKPYYRKDLYQLV